MATGDTESHIRIWDTTNGKELHPVGHQERGIQKIRLAADGKSVMVLDEGGKLCRRRLPDGKLIYRLDNKEVAAFAFATSARGAIFAIVEQSAINVHDAATGDSRCGLDTGDWPSCVDLSVDGRMLAWANYGAIVHLCDAKTGREVRLLKGHKDGAANVVFSPDGRTLVTVGHDNTIRVWDTTTGQERKRLNDNFGTTKVFFSPGGQTLAVSGENSLVLWETKDYRRFQEIRLGREGKLSALVFSADGKTLACADEQGTVILYDAATGEAVDALRGHEGRVNTAAFGGDGKTLYTGSDDGTILAWDLTTPPTPPPSPRARDELPTGAVLRLGDVRFWSREVISSLDFSPNGKILAVSVEQSLNENMEEPAVRLLEIPSGKERRRLQKLPSSLSAIAFSPDSQSLAGVTPDGELIVWDVATGRRRYSLAVLKLIHIIAYSPDSRCLATAENKAVSLRDAATGRELRRLQGFETRVDALAFSSDCKHLACSSCPSRYLDAKRKTVTHPGVLRLWDVAGGKLLREITYHGQKSFTALHFSHDGKTLMAWQRDGGVLFYDAATCREVHTLVGPFAAAVFSADGKFLATGGSAIHLWELPAGREFRAFPARGNMRLLTFSPDGKTLAAVDGGRIRLWDIARGEEISSYAGHRSAVQSLSCTEDGRTLVSAGSDGTIRVWDIAKGKQRRVLEDRKAAFRSVVVSGDGRTVAAMDGAGAVTFWTAKGQKLGHFAGNKRNLFAPHLWYGPTPLLVFSAEARTALVGRKNGDLRIWETGQVKSSLLLPADEDGGIPVAVSPDKVLVASIARRSGQTIGGTGILHLRRLDSGQEKYQIKGEGSDLFQTAAFSPDGKILAVSRIARNDSHGLAFYQPRLLFWEVATGKRFLKIDLSLLAQALAFSPDGKLLATDSGADIRVWDVTTGKLLEELPGHGGAVNALLFSPDGRRLFSGGDDGLILVWDTHWPHPRTRRTRGDLSEEQLRNAWADLAGADVVRAYRSLSDLTSDPRRAVPFLRRHLPAPPAVDRQLIARRIADLDSDDFAVRDKARKELQKQGELAENALRKTLSERPSLEIRRQIETLLKRLQQIPPTAENLRLSRAMLALEWMDAAEARRLIETLAQGTPEARLTQEAKAAWRRLHRRSPAAP